jgi:hypothetical protein
MKTTLPRCALHVHALLVSVKNSLEERILVRGRMTYGSFMGSFVVQTIIAGEYGIEIAMAHPTSSRLLSMLYLVHLVQITYRDQMQQ